MIQFHQTESAELSRKLLSILDELLTSCNWESSLFLKNAGKRLQSLKQEANQLVDAIDKHSKAPLKETIVPEGKSKIFISLYQMDANNLSSWLHTIKSLSSYNVSRPTYGSEGSVHELISSKVDIERHGYVVAIVDNKDIINIDPPLVDALGHNLLLLKENALQESNIIEFIHANRKKYNVKENDLVFAEEVFRQQ